MNALGNGCEDENKSEYFKALLACQTAEQIREFLLNLGFNGLFFQRWYPDYMENWEGHLPRGFLELYYGAYIYKSCPVAKKIHLWRRSYTFEEARKNSDLTPDTLKANNLYSSFGFNDGAVIFAGTRSHPSALILTTPDAASKVLDEYLTLITLAASLLNDKLRKGHELFSEVTRSDPKLSPVQAQILDLHINDPTAQNSEIAKQLNMSVKTLNAHHKKIASKHGVSSFAGAVIAKFTNT